jgi:hypothetical protein
MFSIHQILEKKWEYNGTVHKLFMTARTSNSGEVLYNILIEFSVPIKLVRLIKMYFNKTYSKVHIGKHLSDLFPIQDGLKQEDDILPLLFSFWSILTMLIY